MKQIEITRIDTASEEVVSTSGETYNLETFERESYKVGAY